MNEKIERGTFFLVSANGFSMVANYLIYIILGKFLLGAEQLGVYAVVISLVSVIEMVLVKAVQQSVSKFVSERPGSVQDVKLVALKLLVPLNIAMFAVYFAGSNLIASAFADLSLAPYIQVASFLFLLHPVFSVFMGCLNGLRRFVTQAKLRAFYALLKLALVSGLAYSLSGLYGAIGGFVLASFFGMAVGFFLTRGKGAEPSQLSYKRFFAFLVPIIAMSILTDLLVSIDLFAVKALTGQGSSTLAGYYIAASTIARVFPLVISAIAFIVFPLVSATTFRKDIEKTRFYIRNTLRYTLLAVLPFALLFASTPKELVTIVYSLDYLPAASPLASLSIAFAAYTFFIILTTIIAASDRPKTASLIAFVALAVSAVLNFVLVPVLLIEGAALSTLVASFAGLILSAGFVLLRFKALVPLKSFSKILAASLLVYAISLGWPLEGLLLIGKYLILLAVYAAALLLMKELSKKDLNIALNVVR
ncbi:MAG: oligosaccharide flippase family protein [Candidatus Diapherotrites archaeon]|uniref:Oligosaccharide flippase family protein n=1 Tax=Candidatus Iainarchaeum sp. TaxID=3101447 RepID=A0A939C9U5_9ARCH|nr:oligosaccharide flippase family protein [Candidatus Diapherotrites archaeon]